MRCATPVQCWAVGHLTVDDAPCLRPRIHPVDVLKVIGGGLVGIAWVWWFTAAMWGMASAHPGHELEEWRQAWTQDVLEVGALTPEHVEVWRDMADRHGCAWPGTECLRIAPQPRQIAPPPSVESWRPLVAAYFQPADVDLALLVIGCESGGDPNAKNPNSTASGLFQHLASYWDGRASAAGWAGSSIWNPEANVAVAAWLVYSDGWHHWNPSRGCWS